MSPDEAVESAVAGSPDAMRRVDNVAPPLAVKLSASTSTPPAAVTLAAALRLTVSTSRVLIPAAPKSIVPNVAESVPSPPSTSTRPVMAASGACTVVEFTWVTPAPAVMPVASVTTRFVPLVENDSCSPTALPATNRSPADSEAVDARTIRGSRPSKNNRRRRAGLRRAAGPWADDQPEHRDRRARSLIVIPLNAVCHRT